MSSESDGLKKRLKIDRMNEKDRKKLFQQFIEKGGKVVESKHHKGDDDFLNKEKQKEYLRYIEEHRKRMEKKRQEKKKKSQKVDPQKKLKSEVEKTEGFFLRIKGAFSGVINLFNGSLTDKSYDLLRNVIQDCFINLSYVGAHLLHPKVGGIKKVRRELMKRSPLSYEFLVRMENMYIESEFNTILTPYEENRSVNIRPKKYKHIFRNIFRKIFLFYTNENRIIESVMDGLELASKTRNLSRKFIEDMLIKTKSSLKLLYSTKVFNKMFTLYCISWGESLSLTDFKRIMDSLDIDINEIGKIAEKTKAEIDALYKRSAGSKIMENLEEESNDEDFEVEEQEHEHEENPDEEQENKEEQEEELSEEFLKGKEIFNGLNFKIPGKDSNSRKRFFKNNDKMLYTTVAFNFFDREFSFLLTSNKISYAVDYVDGKKIDLRNGIAEVYTNLNLCKDLVDEYMKIIEEIYKIENDNTIAITQKYNIMHKHQIRQTKISYDMRKRFLENLKELERLLEYSISYELILNKNDKLFFDRIDGNRYLEGKSNFKAVKICLSFVKFLIYLLESEYLSGHNPTIQNK